MFLKNFKLIPLILLLGITACTGVIIISRWHPQRTHPDSAYLSLLKEAHSAIVKRYVEKPDADKLVKSMVDGMLATLDPHSAYLPPEPYKEMEVQMSGAFGGVGIELGMKEGRLIVIAPIEDTPAFRASIQPNDHIWKIDGTLTRGLTINAAVKRMRGEKGTPVALTMIRSDSQKPLVFNLVRDIIKIKSLKARTIAPGYGLIRIAQFQERTGIEFRQALKDLRSDTSNPLKGLIIDMRYNPGGLLSSSIEVANCFIGDDAGKTLIVSTKGREKSANQEIHASLGEKEPRYPIVVLINGGSASASEIVAGALQDHRRAVVMGKQSFGKGSVQSIFPLPKDGALKLTTALYYTPSGRSIQAKGIIPDIEVSTKKPVSRNDALPENIHEKDLNNSLAAKDKEEKPVKKDAPVAVSPHSSSREPDLQTDYQLNRALELLRSLATLKEQGYVAGR